MPLSRRPRRKQERQLQHSRRVIKQTVLTKVRNQRFQYPIVCQHYLILLWLHHHRKVHDQKDREICRTLLFLSVVCNQKIFSFKIEAILKKLYVRRGCRGSKKSLYPREQSTWWSQCGRFLVIYERQIFQDLLCISLGIFLYRGNKDEMFLLSSFFFHSCIQKTQFYFS